MPIITQDDRRDMMAAFVLAVRSEGALGEALGRMVGDDAPAAERLDDLWETFIGLSAGVTADMYERQYGEDRAREMLGLLEVSDD